MWRRMLSLAVHQREPVRVAASAVIARVVGSGAPCQAAFCAHVVSGLGEPSLRTARLLFSLVTAVFAELPSLAAVQEAFPLDRLQKIVDAVFSVSFAEADSERLALTFRLLRTVCYTSRRECPDAARYVTDWAVRFADCYAESGFSAKRELGGFLTAAMRLLGAREFFSSIPHGLEAGRPRSWLLAIARDGVYNCDAQYLITEIAPLAERVRALATGPARLVSSQLAALFPGFFTLPVDAPEVLPRLLDLLRREFSSQPAERGVLCRALCILARDMQSIANGGPPVNAVSMQQGVVFQAVSQRDAEESLAVLRGQAVPILALVLEAACSAEPGSSAFALPTVEAVCSACGTQTADQILSLLTGQLQSASEPSRSTLLEALGVAAKFGTEESRLRAARLLATAIAGGKDGLEKSAYRGLCSVLQAESVSPALVEVATPLVSGSNGGRQRLSFLIACAKVFPAELLQPALPALLPETILAMCDAGGKTRKLASDLLLVLCLRLRDTFLQFYTAVSAGLAGASSQMISATIAALSLLTFEFPQEARDCPAAALATLDSLFILQKAGNRDAVRASLAFVRVFLRTWPPSSLGEDRTHLLVNTLLAWSNDYGAQFRLPVRHILERIMRRIGSGALQSHAPPRFHALLRSIRKQVERRKRAPASGQSSDPGQSDGESLDDFLPPELRRAEDRQSLDVLGSHQTLRRDAPKKRRCPEEIPVAADGRIVVPAHSGGESEGGPEESDEEVGRPAEQPAAKKRPPPPSQPVAYVSLKHADASASKLQAKRAQRKRFFISR